ncbi:MAG TPA: DUF3857 and transglutaminase domain-containing protein [Terriglobales bacterium]
MRKFVSFLTSTFALLLLVAVPKSFAENWPPIAPEDLKMTSVAEQPGAPAVILLRQETDDDTKNQEAYYERIKILTQAGLRYADIELPYDRRSFTIIAISGRTIHADGTLIKFNGKALDKVIEKAHGIKQRVKVFSLPDVQVGSIVDIRYTLSYGDRTIIAPTWDVQSDLFQKKVTFKFYPYMEEWADKQTGRSGQGVAWTPYLPKEYRPQQHVPSVVDPNTDGKTWVDMAIDNVPALVDEPYMPPEDTFRWRVSFYYTTTSKQENFWKDEGKYWNKDVDGFLSRKGGIDTALAQIIAPADTPEQKIRKIYAFISKLENRSFMREKAVQELQAQGMRFNRGADDVLQQRSGDHDDLNRLFVAMVRTAGIPAWLMRVPDRGKNLFEPYFLSPQQFDAEISIVQLDGKDMFFDPGTQFCPYGLLPWHYSSVQGQRQNAHQDTEIVTSTPPEYQQNVIKRVAVIKLADDGTENGTVAVSFDGLAGMDRRERAAQTDQAGRKKLLEDEIKEWLPGGSEVNMTNEPAWDDSTSPLVAHFDVSGPLAVRAGKRRVVPLHIFEVNDQPMFAAADRANNIYFDNPYWIVDEMHISLPQGTSAESMPTDTAVRLDYALYESKQKMEQPTTIYSMRNIVMGGMAFPKTSYKEIKDFYDKVSTGDGQQVLLKATDHAEGN